MKMERLIILVFSAFIIPSLAEPSSVGETILSTVLTPDGKEKTLTRQGRSYYDPRFGPRPLYDRLEYGRPEYDRPSRCGRCYEESRYDDRDDRDYDRSRDRDGYDDDRRGHRPTSGSRHDRNRNDNDEDDRRYSTDRNNNNNNGTDDENDGDNKKRPYDDKDDRDRPGRNRHRNRNRDRDRNRYDDRDKYRPDYYDRFLSRDPYREGPGYERPYYEDPYRERRPLYDRYDDPYAAGGFGVGAARGARATGLSVSARAAAVMGNQHSAAHATIKPRKNVHWKSAGRPAVPGKPDITPILSEDEPNAITLRWAPAAHDGGAPLQGYQVECNRLGSADWIRTSPPLVLRPELVLSGLEPPHRYQFRVAAINAVGRSDFSELSDVLNVSSDRGVQEPPVFLQHLEDVIALENDQTEFRVTFTGSPAPTIAWFKDDYEIFSSRRTAITTTENSSVLLFHQTLASDEGEIKCTATNRAGHAVTKSHLSLEAAPKLRYPRQYEDGLLYEINETVFLKTTVVGKPTPTIEWRHDGQPIVPDDRVEVTNTGKFSMLKIHTARRSDRGEYQIHAKNSIGEDTAAFLVTITAPPDPPRRVSVARQVDKSVTLNWEPPEDDGGCRVGNYVVEYYRTGWNVWLKATTSRKTSVTLFDLIEGSEYRFRVKAESPYGMSAPSADSAPVRIPGRAVDMEFLAIESRIISEELTKVEGEEPRVSPAPRRKRMSAQVSAPAAPMVFPAAEATPPAKVPRAATVGAPVRRRASLSPARDRPDEFMLVLYPDNKSESTDKAEKRKSFQLELEDALSPPPLSLSAPELSARCIMPFKALRYAVSSTELLHERAMARFYKAVELEQEHEKLKASRNDNIPYNTSQRESQPRPPPKPEPQKTPEIFIKTDSVEDKEYKYSSRQASHDSEASDSKWTMSFDEDYTASTVSTDEDYEEEEEEGSHNGDASRHEFDNEEDTYHPRDKLARHSPLNEDVEEEESEREVLKPLPLPDPNFIPKPILKRREPEVQDIKTAQSNGAMKPEEKSLKDDSPKKNEKPKKEDKPKKEVKPVRKEEKPKKEEKLSIFKKFTKMPVQKPFPFPKILKKAEPEKEPEEEEIKENDIPKATKKVEQIEDKITDEGRTVIDYYGSIVKEFGSQKKTATQLYLNTDDLKTVAEKQQHEKKEQPTKETKVTKQKRTVANKTSPNKAPVKSKANAIENKTKPTKPKQASKPTKSKLEKSEKNEKEAPVYQEENTPKKVTQQIALKTERATIVIPIDYKELEQKAKENVRSAIDYAVDLCLLLLAFWVYLFKDERLAIPFLILIIYRQLQETLHEIPEWVKAHTPNWLKKKTS